MHVDRVTQVTVVGGITNYPNSNSETPECGTLRSPQPRKVLFSMRIYSPADAVMSAIASISTAASIGNRAT